MQSKMAARPLIVLSALGLANAVTPVEKVIKLLDDLKAEVESDGTAEATAYDEFACFCKEQTEKKSTSIKTEQDDIDTNSATIQEKTAEKGQEETELAERKEKQEKLTSDLSATQTRCANEKASYEASNQDLEKAISSLEKALTALSGSKPAAASFLAIRTPIERSLILADALNLLATPKRQAAAAFLQKSKVDPDDPDYKFHSQGVLDTISELLEDFKKQKETADAEWGKTDEACKDTEKSISDEMTSNEEGMTTASEAINTLTEEIGTTRQNLLDSEAQLKDDKVYLKDLTSLCEVRAKDWDQRSSLRNGEVEALSQALAILQDRVQGADETANQRALLQASKNASHNKTVAAVPAAKKPVSLLQTIAVHNAVAESTLEMQKVSRVVDFLQGEGQRLHSSILGQVAAKADQPRFDSTPAYDPFKKVKKLIQGLVERLVKEATSEATKKGFCDTELGKATQDRDFRLADANKLNAELAGLEAKKDALEQEIEALTGDLGGLRDDLNTTTINRGEEKEANMETLKTAREGLEAVKEAISILKTFYKEAAKASSLLQYSPVSDDTSGPGFEGSYSGKQAASKGVIGTLEVIKTDFERTISTTKSAEKTAAADFVEFDRTSKADIGSKETKVTLDQEDLETTNNSIAQGHSDLQSQMNLLDSALKTLEELKPTCTDLTMPYEERVAKREEEIEALKKALCILDKDGVEAECSR
eukprot:TRINITY_DN24871_c0_g1_i1.p1 TRINITY_DN24871_c0_g1~~TRINITY_DN24871_c0_g1_i1.p1  ORF type:complete len:727 (-),score=293.57 TRINITY_DN24871_c0_g1_i1:126-2258(-)